MNQENAQNAVNSAALVLAGIYFYRKLIEPSGIGTTARAGRQPRTMVGATEQFFGRGEVAPAGRFILGWGVTFLSLSLLVGWAPDLAGYFALLIALGALLGNGAQVFADLQEQLNRTALPAAADTSTPTVTVSYAGAPSVPVPSSPARPRRRGGGGRPRFHLESV